MTDSLSDKVTTTSSTRDASASKNAEFWKRRVYQPIFSIPTTLAALTQGILWGLSVFSVQPKSTYEWFEVARDAPDRRSWYCALNYDLRLLLSTLIRMKRIGANCTLSVETLDGQARAPSPWAPGPPPPLPGAWPPELHWRRPHGAPPLSPPLPSSPSPSPL